MEDFIPTFETRSLIDTLLYFILSFSWREAGKKSVQLSSTLLFFHPPCLHQNVHKNFLVGNKILNDHQKSNETKIIRFTMYNGEAERWL